MPTFPEFFEPAACEFTLAALSSAWAATCTLDNAPLAVPAARLATLFTVPNGTPIAAGKTK